MAEEVFARELLVKQSGERLKYSMDFTARIDTGVTISSINNVTSTTVGDNASSLTIEDETIVGKKVTFFISGGTHAKSYTVLVNITLSNTEILIGAGMLRVLDA